MKYRKYDEETLHVAGTAAAVYEILKTTKPRSENHLREMYRVLAELSLWPPTAGVVVENRYPGTQREHIVVAPCRLLDVVVGLHAES